MSETCTDWDGALACDEYEDELCWVIRTMEGTGVEAFATRAMVSADKFPVSARGHPHGNRHRAAEVGSLQRHNYMIR
jgi:hypothetical protein